MESDTSKLCIVCCRSFTLTDQTQHAEEISKLSEHIKNYNQIDASWNQVNFYEQLRQLKNSFDTSICSECVFDLKEVLKSNKAMDLMESNVISLQIQILNGLRELEECLKQIKCQQEKIKITVEKADVSCLEKIFLSDVNQDVYSNFALELRQWIIQNVLPNQDRKLKGSLSIPPTEANKLKHVFVKVEAEPELDNDDDDHFDSNSFWDQADQEIIKTDPEKSTNQINKKQRIKYEKMSSPSSMTLRRRTAIKSRGQIKPIITLSTPIKTCLKKPKRKKTPRPPPIKSTKKIEFRLKPKSPKPNSTISAPRFKPTFYKCQQCPFETRRLPSFEQHLKEHELPTASTLLKCPQCPSEFSTNQYLEFHQKLHQDVHKMCCDICYHFFPVLFLQDHLKSHFPLNPKDPSPSPPKITFCQNCSFCCTTPQAYINHQRRHYVGETSRFPCSICSEHFDTPKKLVRHYPQAHEGIGQMSTCDVENCSRTFPSKDMMLEHKRNVHKFISKIVPCKEPNCGKMFSSNKSMEVHFCTHSGEKPFPCDLCGERFLQRDGLRSHRRRVHGAAKSKCKICGVEFFSPRTLKGHMALHENKGVSCEICGMAFGSKYLLGQHLWTHSEEMRWTCEQCGKGFKSRGGWKEHLAMHEEKKNWNCEYCGKGFVRKSNLGDHLRVHTGERPYICDVCGKDFNQASALRVHKKKQHQQ